MDVLKILLEGTTSLELGDEACREFTRLMLTRHRKALIQLETAYMQDKGALQWIQSNSQPSENSSS